MLGSVTDEPSRCLRGVRRFSSGGCRRLCSVS
jgi:hypothetical protein